ncbi:hypothetical protein [Chelativorans sp. J32]|jgi:hypothetical protein|uniref:hypothetical protein n=1 Tax=Chelativorans sp. J32 TaxID=935840 RepID=UPI0012EB7416|nr:hypothetical protein [Chelativorans sp. J32]
MDGMVYEALIDLKKSVDRQNELSDETNNLLRALISTLQDTGQAAADLAEVMREDDDD